MTLKCLGSRWWCLTVGEGNPSSPSLTQCSAGKETLVETTQGQRFSALCCEPDSGRALRGSYCLSNHGSVMIFSSFLILFYVFNNYVFSLSLKVHHNFTYIQLVLHFNWIGACESN